MHFPSLILYYFAKNTVCYSLFPIMQTSVWCCLTCNIGLQDVAAGFTDAAPRKLNEPSGIKILCCS